MHSLKKNIGTMGETIAERFIRKCGYLVLEQNYYTKMGEIDIIAKDDDYIVFIEVKTRYNNKFGTPAESITYYKQSRIYKTAQVYIMLKKLNGFSIRFDVIEINIDKNTGNYKLRLIKNAFQI